MPRGSFYVSESWLARASSAFFAAQYASIFISSSLEYRKALAKPICPGLPTVVMGTHCFAHMVSVEYC